MLRGKLVHNHPPVVFLSLERTLCFFYLYLHLTTPKCLLVPEVYLKLSPSYCFASGKTESSQAAYVASFQLCGIAKEGDFGVFCSWTQSWKPGWFQDNKVAGPKTIYTRKEVSYRNLKD